MTRLGSLELVNRSNLAIDENDLSLESSFIWNPPLQTPEARKIAVSKFFFVMDLDPTGNTLEINCKQYLDSGWEDYPPLTPCPSCPKELGYKFELGDEIGFFLNVLHEEIAIEAIVLTFVTKQGGSRRNPYQVAGHRNSFILDYLQRSQCSDFLDAAAAFGGFLPATFVDGEGYSNAHTAAQNGCYAKTVKIFGSRPNGDLIFVEKDPTWVVGTGLPPK